MPTTTMAEKQKRRATVLAKRKQMPAKRRRTLKPIFYSALPEPSP